MKRCGAFEALGAWALIKYGRRFIYALLRRHFRDVFTTWRMANWKGYYLGVGQEREQEREQQREQKRLLVLVQMAANVN